jgi:hypothetical protein
MLLSHDSLMVWYHHSSTVHTHDHFLKYFMLTQNVVWEQFSAWSRDFSCVRWKTRGRWHWLTFKRCSSYNIKCQWRPRIMNWEADLLLLNEHSSSRISTKAKTYLANRPFRHSWAFWWFDRIMFSFKLRLHFWKKNVFPIISVVHIRTRECHSHNDEDY